MTETAENRWVRKRIGGKDGPIHELQPGGHLTWCGRRMPGVVQWFTGNASDVSRSLAASHDVGRFCTDCSRRKELGRPTPWKRR